MGASGNRRVAIACQGGGSHTAFTAGVLARLLQDELGDGELVGLSGTSGGAVCALLAWWALREGDRHGAGPLLEAFWADNAATTPWEQLLNAAVAFAGDMQQFVTTPAVSPYDNPFAEVGAAEFKRLLERRVDFDAIETGDDALPALLVSRALGARTKLNRDPAFIGELIAHGREQAGEFVAALRFERAWRERDLDGLAALLADDVRLRAEPPFARADPADRDGVLGYLRRHLSKLTLDLTRKQVVGDAVTWSVTLRPTGARAAARVVLHEGVAASLALGSPELLEA